jgi:hypothetical protein
VALFFPKKRKTDTLRVLASGVQERSLIFSIGERMQRLCWAVSVYSIMMKPEFGGFIVMLKVGKCLYDKALSELKVNITNVASGSRNTKY